MWEVALGLTCGHLWRHHGAVKQRSTALLRVSERSQSTLWYKTTPHPHRQRSSQWLRTSETSEVCGCSNWKEWAESWNPSRKRDGRITPLRNTIWGLNVFVAHKWQNFAFCFCCFCLFVCFSTTKYNFVFMRHPVCWHKRSTADVPSQPDFEMYGIMKFTPSHAEYLCKPH